MDGALQVYSICSASEQHYVLNTLTLPAALTSDTAVGAGWFNTERVDRAYEVQHHK